MATCYLQTLKIHVSLLMNRETLLFEFKQDRENQPSVIDVTVRYHLLDEKTEEENRI